MLIGCSLNADVNLVLTDDGSRLVAVKSFDFRVVVDFALNIAAERISFYRRLASFLDDPKRLVLITDWNAIFDPKMDRVERKASESGMQPDRFFSSP